MSESKDQREEPEYSESLKDTHIIKERTYLAWLKNHELEQTVMEEQLDKLKITMKDLAMFSVSDINDLLQHVDLSFLQKRKLKKALLSLPKPLCEQNQQKKKMVGDKLEHQLLNRVEAYSTFEVVSSLIFGFSISVLFSSDIKENFDENKLLEAIFTVIMTMVLVLSSYSMIASIVVSISHYFVNRYVADYTYRLAIEYLAAYQKHRKYARWSFYISDLGLLISLALYLSPNLTFVSSVISAIVTGFGVMFLMFTMYQMLNPHKYIPDNQESEPIPETDWIAAMEKQIDRKSTGRTRLATLNTRRDKRDKVKPNCCQRFFHI
eukprot:140422_1